MKRTLLLPVSLSLLLAVLIGGWQAPARFTTPTSAAVQLTDDPQAMPAYEVCFAPGTPPEVVAEWQRRTWGSGSLDYRTGGRWRTTASGSTGSTGNPITLTYSFVPDGTPMDGQESQLFSRFNQLFGSEAVWQALFAQIFGRWSELSGLHYIQTTDDGAAYPNSPGVLGVRGDVRIAAIDIDGPSNVLARDWLPDISDMQLDAAENWAAGPNHIFLRNIVAHEHGHGFGLLHVCPDNGTKLLEPYYSENFDGPQHDDIRGAQRYYGDHFENNDDYPTATRLGAISADTAVTDIGIDRALDRDYYRFSIPAGHGFTLTAEPIGHQYLEGPQNDDGSCSAGTMINSLDDLNLSLYLLHSSLNDTLVAADSHPAGELERIYRYLPPAGGDSFVVLVSGSESTEMQLYQLQFDLFLLTDPFLSLNPVDFDTVWLGHPADLTTRLINNAASTLSVSSIELTAPFSVSPLPPFSIPGHDSITLWVNYQATTLGTQERTMTIHHNGSGGPLEALVTGTTVNSYLQFVNSNSVDFGDVRVGTVDSARVLVRAAGNLPLTIQSILAQVPFSLPLDLPLTLNATQSLALWPRFTPTSLGPAEGQIVLIHSGLSSPDTIFVHGNGISAAHEIPDGLPQAYRLLPNYPNPFNAATMIVFELPRASQVDLDIYDLQGRLVERLASGLMNAGRHSLAFDGARLSSGVYICRLTAPGFSALQKMMLLK